MTTPKAIIILAEGFEETEAITVVDILRRANIKVTICGFDKNLVTGSHNITIKTDTTFGDYLEKKEFPDTVILPGGIPGSENLAKSESLKNFLIKMNTHKKIIAAICASPALVLANTGVLNGKNATCYPGMETYFDNTTVFKEDSVVVDSNIITSRGVATSLKFALAIVEKLVGKNTAFTIKDLTLA